MVTFSVAIILFFLVIATNKSVHAFSGTAPLLFLQLPSPTRRALARLEAHEQNSMTDSKANGVMVVEDLQHVSSLRSIASNYD
eukprot:scaffold4635_cov22-Attheya_sp.AAC.1